MGHYNAKFAREQIFKAGETNEIG
ncbi:hypothetical protein MIC448_260041 [Microbacterium sp. C448]|nr:hypothetical protein MIC448_260041 [Microbacterium sp. C448]